MVFLFVVLKIKLMNKIIFLTLFLAIYSSMAQSIKGKINQVKNTEIILTGYDGFTKKELAKTTTDSLGNFTLVYPKNYIGAASLEIKSVKNYLVILLNHENFSLQWTNHNDFKTLRFINSAENNALSKAMIINQDAEDKLAALKYLLPLYKTFPIKKEWIEHEIKYQEAQFSYFLKQLPSNSYAKYYLKIRKIISDFPITANQYPNRISTQENEFKNIDFENNKLWNSGLLEGLFDGFYQLMETYKNITEITNHTNSGTNSWLTSLDVNPLRKQEIAEYCFKKLEKRSQFSAAEYLALKMLNQSNCKLDEKRTSLFEQYRKMAIGNTAPNIILNLNTKKSLESIDSKYKLVIFGASWCPNCQTDYPKLVNIYKFLKDTYQVEIIYISIDTNFDEYTNYYKNAPFLTYCDSRGWDTPAAKNYFVFATPTYFLLDKELKIMAKIQSPEHLEAWLKSKNK